MADEKESCAVMEQAASRMGEVTMKMGIDVSDALKGLKAVQREARKATVALKEFEEKQKEMSQELYKRHYLCTWVNDDLPIGTEPRRG